MSAVPSAAADQNNGGLGQYLHRVYKDDQMQRVVQGTRELCVLSSNCRNVSKSTPGHLYLQ